jgi:hypothetical protein
MAQHFSPRIVTDGMVLCLDAGNRESYPGSGTSWTDLSGNNNNGTLVSSPTYSANNLGYLTFNGSTQYVAGTIASVSTWSIGLWYISTNISSAVVYYPFGIGGTTGLGFGGTSDVNTNGRWYFFDGTTSVTVANGFSAAAVSINTWYYLTVTKTGTSYNLYTNGVFSSSASGANLSISSYNLGRRVDGFWYVAGSIAGASIYNRALSAAEVSQNFNATRGRFGV